MWDDPVQPVLVYVARSPLCVTSLLSRCVSPRVYRERLNYEQFFRAFLLACSIGAEAYLPPVKSHVSVSVLNERYCCGLLLWSVAVVAAFRVTTTIVVRQSERRRRGYPLVCDLLRKR